MDRYTIRESLRILAISLLIAVLTGCDTNPRLLHQGESSIPLQSNKLSGIEVYQSAEYIIQEVNKYAEGARLNSLVLGSHCAAVPTVSRHIGTIFIDPQPGVLNPFDRSIFATAGIDIESSTFSFSVHEVTGINYQPIEISPKEIEDVLQQAAERIRDLELGDCFVSISKSQEDQWEVTCGTDLYMSDLCRFPVVPLGH